MVSVVIPIFNHWDVTARALESLLRCDPEVNLQIIVVDDASSDDSAAHIATIPGIDLVRNGINLGFVHSCNRGAAIARGRYLYFLNNDTELASGAVRTLVSRLESDGGIGVVGSKLIYPDGRLQEAGGVIWSDAGGLNYGRLDRADRPKYNFARDVDYVSGASLMIRASLFRAIGGFDERFAPAYYEDADLCFAARAHGYRVVYEPESEVTHDEGHSSGTDLASGMKQFQTANQPRFRAKWAAVLDSVHQSPEAGHANRAARSRGGERRAVLIVDGYVPLYDREAGSNRLQLLIDGFKEAGTRVVFFPDNLTAIEPYTADLQRSGVEVIYKTGDESWRELFIEALESVDLVWICRPLFCRKYLPLVRDHSNAAIVYDTIDLHHLRMRRQFELEGVADDRAWQAVEELELSCAFAADGTIVVSNVEAEVLQSKDVSPIAVIPTIHDLEDEQTVGYAASSGVLFIGGFKHEPNIDGARWLVEEIMPLVWAEIPELVVTLLGSDPPENVLDLAGPQVIVPGFIRDVSPYFRRARIFAGSLRYGAGIKGKIGQALAFGVPVVTTQIGAEGFGITTEISGIIANDRDEFAAAIVRLYRDGRLWNHISKASASVLTPFRSSRIVADALTFIDAAIATRSL